MHPAALLFVLSMDVLRDRDWLGSGEGGGEYRGIARWITSEASSAARSAVMCAPSARPGHCSGVGMTPRSIAISSGDGFGGGDDAGVPWLFGGVVSIVPTLRRTV